MPFQVVVLKRARQDISEYYDWIFERAPTAAGLWLDRLQQALGTLAEHPERCGLAKESRKAGKQLRELLVGRKAAAFRAVFTIDGQTVYVLRVRRGQRAFLTQSEIEDALE